MKWEVFENAKRDNKHESHVLMVEDEGSQDNAFVLFWTRVLEVFTRVYSDVQWNCVIVSVRPDSGRIIGFAGRDRTFLAEERAVVWVKLPILEHRSYQLPNPDTDPAGFEAGIAGLFAEAFASVANAARHEPAKSAVQQLLLRGVTVLCIEYNDLETAQECLV